MRLTPAEARRMLLWNQRLTGVWTDPIEVISDLVAVQTQYAQSLPSVLASRLKSGRFDWIEREIAPGGKLIKSWTVRHTLHTMSVPMFELLRTSLEAESYKAFLHWCRRGHGEDEPAVAERNAKVLAALEDGPLTRAQLHDLIPEFKSMQWTGWGADVKGLAIQGRLAMCSHKGETKFFRRDSADLGLSARQARAEILRAYMRAFGPASKSDFNYWYGGYVPPVSEAWTDVLPELEPVEMEGRRGLYVLANSPPVADYPELPLVRLLAKFDTLLLGHKDKSLYLNPENRDKVFRKAGQVEGAVLVRGEVAGTWRARLGAKGVVLLIERWPRTWSDSTMRAIEREAARQARAYGRKSFSLEIADG